MDMTIDSLDNRIIELLLEDAHQSSVVLGKQLGVSSSTIRRRLNRMVEKGVIKIVAYPDPNSIGLGVVAIITLNVSHDKLDKVMKELRDYTKIKWVAAISGRFDIMATVWIESTEELYKFLENEIAKIEGITKSETFICLHVEKRF